MRNYVIINGVNSLTIQGLAIKTLPPITKPIQRNLREEIDGRDGDIVTTLGYGAYDKTIEIGLFGTFDIDEVIAYFNQKGTITFSNEADKVYYFEALDQVDYAELLKFRTANVVLHCQPFKYPLNETPLEEEYEYVEGEGTELTLNDTSNSIFNKFDVLGNTSQIQYTGKNLSKLSDKASTTTNGITYSASNQVGIFSGTTNANATTTLSFDTFTLSAGTYSFCLFRDTTSRMDISLRKAGTNEIVSATNFGNAFQNKINVRTFTLTEEISFQNMTIWIPSGIATNDHLKFMIVSGSYTTSNIGDYEPYVGGTASPNPQYPQNVNVVSGDNEINICGKNLLNVNSLLTYNVWTYYLENPFKESGTYTYSFTNTSYYGNTSHYFSLKFGDDYTAQSSTQINGVLCNSSFGTFTITNEMTSKKYLFFYPNSARDLQNIKDSMFMVEKRSTKTTYEPYIGNSYPIYLGVENLLDTQGNLVQSHNGINYSYNSNGSFTMSGTATSTYSNSFNVINGIINQNETYTLSVSGTRNFSIGFRLFYSDNTSSDFNIGTSSSYVNIIPTKTPTSFRVYIYGMTTGNSYNATLFLQLEKGNKVNSFNKYGTTPIELCKIGTYQDYIYKGEGYNLFDDSIYVNGYPTGAIGSQIGYGTSSATKTYKKVCQVEAGQQYVLSWQPNAPASTGTREIKITDNNEIILESITYSNTNNTRTKTFTPNNSGWLYVPLDMNATQPQIEKGSTALPYEPYNAKDKWLVHKEIGKYQITGNETIVAAETTQSGKYRFAINAGLTNIITIDSASTIANIYCNYLKAMSRDNSYANVEGICYGISNGSYGNFIIYNENAVTTPTMTTWLSTNKPSVYYILANSTAYEITDTTLLEQLESLSMASSIQGQTNISQENNDLPFILSVSTLKDGSDHLIINNIGNIYAKPTLDLEGNGIVDIYLNDTQMFEVDLSETNEIVINTQEMEAYNPTTNALANRQVVGDYSKFKLDSGENDLRFSGALTKATITNYQRWL